MSRIERLMPTTSGVAQFDQSKHPKDDRGRWAAKSGEKADTVVRDNLPDDVNGASAPNRVLRFGF